MLKDYFVYVKYYGKNSRYMGDANMVIKHDSCDWSSLVVSLYQDEILEQMKETFPKAEKVVINSISKLN